MEKQNYINKIREACIKANPEIVELKFGCEVEITHKASDYFGRKLFVSEKPDAFGVLSVTIPNFYSIAVSKENIEIIGRPIHLADVLLAIIDKNKLFKHTEQLLGTVAIHWKLENDNLENQSEETLKFIVELL